MVAQGVNSYMQKFFMLCWWKCAVRVCVGQAKQSNDKEVHTMKKFRKGFTLVELLIVIAVLGSLSAMMAFSSSESVNSATVASIISDLKSMKSGASFWYFEHPDKNLNITPADNPTDDDNEFAGLLGTTASDLKDSNYFILSQPGGCFVFYGLTEEERANPNLLSKLQSKAKKAGLYGATTWTSDAYPFGFTSTYDGKTTTLYVGVKVR